MLFKTGIAPKWEDPANAKGGKWAIESDKKWRAYLDSTWLETLLAVIGEGKSHRSILLIFWASWEIDPNFVVSCKSP